jgi:ATP-dependent Clp protease ATP-binding subunit ClpX
LDFGPGLQLSDEPDSEAEVQSDVARLQERVAQIPQLRPVEIDARLQALGYRGQPRARRAAAVMAYRHVQRLRRLYLEGMRTTTLGPRQNLLFLGPTGSGKTYLVELLFRSILQLPTVIVDMTSFTETGYVGDEVSSIPSRLVDAADGDALWAGCGLVCLDEFDKVAAQHSTARLGGMQTTKDISGYGVQRSLLTLLSSNWTEFAPDGGYSGRTPKSPLHLAGTTWIGCGAFSGVVPSTASNKLAIGFGAGAATSPIEEVEPGALERAGFLPELVSRFSQLVQFGPLSGEVLRELLETNVLQSYRDEFAREGLDLQVDAEVVDQVVEQALQQGHGARGLHSSLAAPLEEASFCHFGFRRTGSVRLRVVGGQVVAETNEEKARERSLG